MDVFYHIVSGAVLVVAVTVDVLRISFEMVFRDCGNHYFALVVIVARVFQGRWRYAASPLGKRRFGVNV